MKRLLTLFVVLLAFLAATAQEEYPIILDQASLRKMVSQGTDNANIDPIRKDSSRKPCARIKIRFANMSRAEVDELKIERKSNNDLVRQEILFYDNVLILEMTARPDTRFYVQSPEYGQSNEVSLNLEGDCEYEMEARLNSRFSIVVESNVAGAEVYIDGVKKAVTDSNFKATIDDVMVGSHNLKVSYNGVSAAKTIEVRKGSISFGQNVDKSALEPQYVAFEVSPANALVIIDNKQLTLDDGTLSIVMQPGRYEYIVSAKLYHTERGEFTVAGSKVVKHITLQPAFGYLSVGGGALSGAAVFVDDELIGTAPVKSDKLSSGEHSVRLVLNKYKPYTTTVTIRDNQTTNLNPTLSADFATVSLTAPNGATIWVNGTQKGTGSWSGELSTGTYIFEARKEGHRAQKLTKTISATPARQSYTLDAPTPITGSVDINSSPAMADVYLDGKLVGSSPMKINDIIVGNHTLKLSRKGYYDYTKTVTITEGKTTTVTATLTKQSAPASATTTTPKPISSSSSGTYNIGDLVTVNGVKGIVFQTSPVVKIVSVKEGYTEWGEDGVTTKATDKDNGKVNMAKIKAITGWETKYPAFKWCADLGEGWYLPAHNELKAIYKQRDMINKALSANNMDKLGSKDSCLWSSSEGSSRYVYSVSFSSGSDYDCDKDFNNAVRAVYVIASSSNATSASVQTPTPSAPSSVTRAPKTYNIGDLVTVKGVQGIVFQTSPVVKIVSVKETTAKWGGYGVTTNATNKDTGKVNMAIIKSISGWETKYPAFKWCADYGNGWYLPALNELKAIYAQRDKINKTLSANNMGKLGSKDIYSILWSSTERDTNYAYELNFSGGYSYDPSKYNTYSVRAVIALN